MIKFLFIFIIFLTSLYSYTLDNVPVRSQYIMSDSTVCNVFGDPPSVYNNKIINVSVSSKSYTTDSYWYDKTDTYILSDTQKEYNGVKCGTSLYVNSYWNYGTRLVIFAGRTANEWIKVNLQYESKEDVLINCEDVPTTPTSTVIGGLNFKSNLDSDSQCESMFNDSGDGLGFSFVNPSSTPDICPIGHCYFNTPLESPCNLPSVPNETILNNFNFQNNYDSVSMCENAFNNNGDGIGFSFVNPTNCTSGHCYYNLPAENPDDNSTGGNGGSGSTGGNDSDDNSNDGGSVVVDGEDITQYVDELEDINRDIISSINNNIQSTNNVNDSLVGVKSSVDNLDYTLNNILTAVNNIDTNNNSSDNTNNSNLNNPYDGLDTITNDDLSSNDTNLNDSMTAFSSDYSNILDDSFTTYADVFGFGGYGAKPNSISFNLLGKNYILFDISYLDGYLEHIRLLFSTFAYLFGIFIFFRSV